VRPMMVMRTMLIMEASNVLGCARL